MTEHEIQQRILLAIGARRDIRVWRNQTGALPDVRGRLVRFGLVGSSDILGVMAPAGRILAIEVKSPTGRQTESQHNFQRMVESMGGLYILARSVEDVIRRLPPESGQQ